MTDAPEEFAATDPRRYPRLRSTRIIVADILFLGLHSPETDALVAGLSGDGHHVATVTSRAAALRTLERSGFDAVVADVAKLEQEDLVVLRGPDLGTEVVLTARGDPPEASTLLAEGAFELLTWPIPSYHLSATIRRAIEHRDSRLATWIAEEGRRLLDATEPGLLPQRIVDLTTRVMAADDVSVMLRQPDGSLYVSFSRGLPQAVQEQAVVRVGERISGRAAETGQPLLLTGPVEGSSSRSIQSSIVYPILHREMLLGVLNISRIDQVRPFREMDLRRAKMIAANVAVALENSDVVRRLVASERLDAFGQLAAGVAHEVNNPVTFLVESCHQVEERIRALGELDAVLKGSASLEEVRRWWRAKEGRVLLGETLVAAEDARAGAERVRDVVRDLRSLTAARGGDRPVDLNEAVRLAVRVAGVEVHSRAQVELDLGDDVMVMADPGRLSVAVVQLLRHGARATAATPEGTTRTLRVESRRQREWVTLQVADSGPGIPRQAVPRLFEPFFTLDGSDEPLDLHVAWEIVRQLGGELRLESTSARGTTFGVLLPAAEALRIAPEPGMRRAAAVGESAADGRRKPRVLFVDDEPLLLRSYVRGFRRELEVVLAEGGPQALARLSEDRDFDLIVTDVVMPSLDGAELYRRVRDLDPALADRFVFVSGSIAHQEATQLLESIPNPFLEKPFEMEALKEILVARGC